MRANQASFNNNNHHQALFNISDNMSLIEDGKLCTNYFEIGKTCRNILVSN